MSDDSEEFKAEVQRRRAARMRNVDSMSPGLRACVHNYGLSVVTACLDLGIREPRHIRHIVEKVLDELSPTRGTSSAQGPLGDLVKKRVAS